MSASRELRCSGLTNGYQYRGNRRYLCKQRDARPREYAPLHRTGCFNRSMPAFFRITRPCNAPLSPIQKNIRRLTDVFPTVPSAYRYRPLQNNTLFFVVSWNVPSNVRWNIWSSLRFFCFLSFFSCLQAKLDYTDYVRGSFGKAVPVL